MKDPSIVSLHLVSFLFFIMKTSNLFHFIIAPTLAHTLMMPYVWKLWIYKATDMSWVSPGSCIHLEDKSHYWCQRGYFQCLPPATITGSHQHGAKVFSLDMPLLNKFIMITRPAVPVFAECRGFTSRMAFRFSPDGREVRNQERRTSKFGPLKRNEAWWHLSDNTRFRSVSMLFDIEACRPCILCDSLLIFISSLCQIYCKTSIEIANLTQIFPPGGCNHTFLHLNTTRILILLPWCVTRKFVLL